MIIRTIKVFIGLGILFCILIFSVIIFFHMIHTERMIRAEKDGVYLRFDGPDVLVPNRIIEAIPGFQQDKPVYVVPGNSEK